MKKKYTYEFVNETVEIEIDEEWAAILEEEDRKEYNIDHRETRRHEGLDTGVEGGDWLLDCSIIPDNICAEEDAKNLIMSKAAEVLTPKQLDAFEKVCIMRNTEKEYANKSGISHQAAHKLVSKARKKLKAIITE